MLHYALLNAELTLDDFTELLWCQCRDFPSQLLQQATHHLKETDDSPVRATLKAFMAAFSACFLYNGAHCVNVCGGRNTRHLMV